MIIFLGKQFVILNTNYTDLEWISLYDPRNQQIRSSVISKVA